MQLNDLSTVTVYSLPVPSMTGGDLLCQNMVVVYTTEAGMSNYIWTVNKIDATSDYQITAGGTVNDNSITIKWTGYQRHSVSVSYTNGNGCTPVSPTVFNVLVYKVPETGPEYHIPNNMGL